MITVLALTGIMADLPQWHEHKGETRDQTMHRLRPTASAIHAAAQRATCYGRVECKRHWAWSANEAMAALVTTGWWESRFAQHVIDGKCRPYECDPVKLPDGTILHKAAGAYQQQAAGLISVSEWKKLPGHPGRQAWAAVRMLGASRDKCKTVAGMFSQYGTGKHCGWGKAPARARTYTRILARLEALPDSEKLRTQ